MTPVAIRKRTTGHKDRQYPSRLCPGKPDETPRCESLLAAARARRREEALRHERTRRVRRLLAAGEYDSLAVLDVVLDMVVEDLAP